MRRRRSYRRWPRRVLVSANVVCAIVLIAVALGYGYVRYELGTIKTGSSAGLSSSDDNPASAVAGPGGGNRASDDPKRGADGLQPENILLIGNETRKGQVDVNFGNPNQLTGSLSDVVMILHLNPVADTASILSIPRDVFVPMPAHSPVGPYQKIDAALNVGKLGPNNLAEAITEDFGIPINHYVEVDFDGFLQTVNALGGIRMDFPERLYDLEAGLDIYHTGCQLLNGQEALALVRSRHLQYDPPGVDPHDTAAWPYDPESDLARIVRDHTFVRVLASTAKSEGLTNPIKLNNFLHAALKQLTIDPGLKGQLIKLALHYGGLNPNGLPATTIPVTQVTGFGGSGYTYDGAEIGDVEFTDQPADTRTIEKWDPGALPAPVTPRAVRVYDISGTGKEAAVGGALKADGFHVTAEEAGEAPATQSETLVQYHPGQLAQGFAVFDKLSGAVILQSVASVPKGTVEVQAGTSLAVEPPAAHHPAAHHAAGKATKKAAPTTTVPTPEGEAPSSAADQLTSYDPRAC